MISNEEKRKRHNEKSRRWREANPEKHLEAVRKSRSKRIETLGREAVLAQHAAIQRKRREDKPDQVRDYERSRRIVNRRSWMIKQIKARAKVRGIEFDLTIEDLRELPESCPVFGFPLDYTRTKAGFNSPTVDRIDNSKGYISGNIIIVSRKANTMKSDGTVSDMLALYEFYRNLDGYLSIS